MKHTLKEFYIYEFTYTKNNKTKYAYAGGEKKSDAQKAMIVEHDLNKKENNVKFSRIMM